MDRIRVALADDHPIVLAGIRTLLNADPEIELVGEATSGSDALPMIHSAGPDVAVVDVSMPGLNGLELAERVAGECPGTRVLVLTVHEDAAYVQPLLRAGARGYLLKRSAADDLLRAVRAVASGGIYLDPSIAGHALADPSSVGGPGPGEAGEALSPREMEVLRLIAQGFSNKEIARRIDLSVKSVETYKARAAEKLGLRTRAEIIRYAAAQGWLDALALR
ncbi:MULTISPECIES: response regulator transcription factor [Methylobacteriaceae]|jgi:DNA-binding NarL/FixJ family response regulator|uniref:Oxygen regulatory protein NreC n=1 Tax=Methylobacterium gregans TaxID=374424 RepID=A0AA37HNW3_9HYPH|nr:response regulator transcription factor [Methylobacterium gregans]MDQ0522368.1 DNA-binding NarL/FixJ family response regulator [Methylobacterium gregans]GJD78926.1 Oxygen regulatory protein NreC [Methylobacterium gregans]GLS55110.1 DNA-binding response regulator [Methylobacterium gregans]